jgi:DNA repair protein RecN (Recombination protein N)
MLRLLRVRNFALINELEIEFDAGLNLLSGETGAGKSLVVDALALIAGRKASSDVVRSGERHAIVEAVFDAPPDLDLAMIGIDADDDPRTLILRREISGDDRNRVFINSQPSTVTGLKTIAPFLLDIHGQHDHQSLLDSARQLALVDKAAGTGTEAKTVAALHHEISSLESELAALDESEAEQLRRLDHLTFEREEIERANPQRNETDELRGQVRRLEHSGRLLDAASSGYQTLYEAESSLLEQLAAIERSIRDVEEFDTRLGPIAEQATTTRNGIEELAFALRDYVKRIDVDPGELDSLQERLTVLERLHRKYGDDLVAHLETVIQEMDTIGLRKSRRDEVFQRLSEVRAKYADLAGSLSRKRRTSAASLEARVTTEIRALAMPHAAFSVQWDTLDPGRATGIDLARFVLAPNPGEDAGPLSDIASGGELSRTMLGLRTVLSGEGSVGTLVFDEVDAGIGGEAAEMVGRRLKGLSDRYQVLCVTHLAQVARFADQHARIEKLVVDGRTVTRIEILAGNARVEELARMMSGPNITDTARKHVRELLRRG